MASPYTDMTDAFGNWLAGFIDGEGCFVAQITKKGQIITHMTIGLRQDDVDILRECQERTGLGKVYERNPPSYQRKGWPPQVNWVVYSKEDCQLLVRLLYKYPLRAKKSRDFDIWSEIVEEHAKRNVGEDTTRISTLMTRLCEGRAY